MWISISTRTWIGIHNIIWINIWVSIWMNIWTSIWINICTQSQKVFSQKQLVKILLRVDVSMNDVYPTEKKFRKNRVKKRLKKPRFWPVFLISGSQTIYAYLKYRPKPRFLKPRYSAVFTIRINGLTPAVFITGENRGF